MAVKTESWIKPYYPAFDGLRAVAILMVFFVHYLAAVKPGISQMELWTGVDLFFVLSGFLITGILFDSRKSPRFFRNFYIRRALRILPICYGFFLLVILLTPILHLHYSLYIFSNPLYVENLFTKRTLLGLCGNPTVIFWRHRVFELGSLWSLSVEEQFYIAWPLVVWLFPDRKTLMRVCSVLIVATIALRIFLFFHDHVVVVQTKYLYNNVYTRSDTLLIGAWVALWLRGYTPLRTDLRRIAHTLFLFGTLTCLTLLLIFAKGDLSLSNPVMYTIGYTLVALAACGVLLRCLDDQSKIHRMLLHPWLKRLGTISYGFYFFHDMAINEFSNLANRLRPYHLEYLIIPLAFACIYALASLSFHYYESYFLKLKSVLAPGHRSVPAPDPGA